jgi:hypothetical protein
MTDSGRGHDERELLLRVVQPALIGLIDGSRVALLVGLAGAWAHVATATARIDGDEEVSYRLAEVARELDVRAGVAVPITVEGRVHQGAPADGARRGAIPHASRAGDGEAAGKTVGMAPGFHDFFLASAGVAGALIGLLFVALSVAGDRLLGEGASQSHRVRASTALTTFTNALAVSLLALIPGFGAGGTASVVATVGLLFVVGSLLSLVRVRRVQRRQLRDAGFLVGVAVVFALQLYFGLRLDADDGDIGALRGVCILVVVSFLVGIARAWELIGGPQVGLRRQIVETLHDHDHDRPDG